MNNEGQPVHDPHHTDTLRPLLNNRAVKTLIILIALMHAIIYFNCGVDALINASV